MSPGDVNVIYYFAGAVRVCIIEYTVQTNLFFVSKIDPRIGDGSVILYVS